MSGNIEGKVREVYIDMLGADAWEMLSEEEQGEAVQITRVYCHNHLRNTCVRHAVKFEQAYMKDDVEECLKVAKVSSARRRRPRLPKNSARSVTSTQWSSRRRPRSSMEA
jgi:hypothetical protein